MTMLADDHVRLDLAEPAHPVIARRDFSDALSRLASSVTVVAANHAGQSLGRTATAVLSLTVAPPSVLVSIDIASPLADMIGKARGFSVAILSEEQQIVADAFAGKLGNIDRFMMGVWGAWPSGHPLLYGAVAALDCELIGTIETATHLLFAGAILHTDILESATPLIWHDRSYRALAKRTNGAPHGAIEAGKDGVQ